METDLKTQTIEDFGEQWTAFRDNPGYYGSADLLSDLFGPLLSRDAVKGRRVADIGSGTGRIVNMLLDAGAEHVRAVEPSGRDGSRTIRQNVAIGSLMSKGRVNHCQQGLISISSCQSACCITFPIQGRCLRRPIAP